MSYQDETIDPLLADAYAIVRYDEELAGDDGEVTVLSSVAAASASGDASWSDAAHLRVHLNLGWSIDSHYAAVAVPDEFPEAFRYEFLVHDDAVLHLAWSTDASDAFRVLLDGDELVSPGSGDGSVSASLQAGRSYTLSLRSLAYASGVTGFQQVDLHGTFQVGIERAVVPEPPSSALAALGALGGLVAWRRRWPGRG